MKNEIRDILPRILMLCFRMFRIDPQKAVFKSFRGLECGDNPRAVYDEMYRRRPDYKYIWITQNMSETVPGAKMVRHGSIREIYELATARLWVDNKRKGCWASKRRGQLYIQTWHGGICLKKIEKDAEENLPAYYIKSAKKDSMLADAMTSSSKWQDSQYREAFWFNNTILKYGLPRSDVYYQEHEGVMASVREAFNLPSDAKLVLYAPTFRDDHRTDVYNIDYNRLLSALESKYGGSWYILVRMHPNVSDRADVVEYGERVINATPYPFMNELVIGADLVITDYSSTMFDAMEAGKKVVIYAADIEQYTKDRGFYFDIRNLPFPLSETNEELINVIHEFDEDSYNAKVTQFNGEVGLYSDGHASERTVDYILQRIEYKNGKKAWPKISVMHR